MKSLRYFGQAKGTTSIIILSLLDRALLVSVEKMSLVEGIKLLGAIEKPITLAQLELLIFQYERSESK